MGKQKTIGGKKNKQTEKGQKKGIGGRKSLTDWTRGDEDWIGIMGFLPFSFLIRTLLLLLRFSANRAWNLELWGLQMGLLSPFFCRRWWAPPTGSPGDGNRNRNLELNSVTVRSNVKTAFSRNGTKKFGRLRFLSLRCVFIFPPFYREFLVGVNGSISRGWDLPLSKWLESMGLCYMHPSITNHNVGWSVTSVIDHNIYNFLIYKWATV